MIMQLKDYIQGDRRGKEANRLEREAMNDPFLREALEGFDAVGGDHAEVIERLENRIAKRVDGTVGIPDGFSVDDSVDDSVAAPQKTGKLFLYWSAAATILLLIGFGAYFLFERNRPNEAAIVMVQQEDYKMQNPASPLQKEVERESVQYKLLESESPEPISAMRAKPEAAPTVKNPVDIIPVTEEMEVVAVVEDEDQEQRMEVYVPQNETSVEEFDEDVIFIQAEELNDTRARSARAASPRAEATPSTAAEEAALSRQSQINESHRMPITFGEKEFQAYCRQKANKKVCGGKKVTVKVTFFINAAGKPTDIRCEKYTCEDAAKEIQNLLISSPAWTTTNKKVTMTIRW